MKKALLILLIGSILSSFCLGTEKSSYIAYYDDMIAAYHASLSQLMEEIKEHDQLSRPDAERMKAHIKILRSKLKAIDIWLRYLEPISYKKINGPLPVEWENEVFEKFERPYRREGAGLILAEQYLDGDNVNGDSLARLIKPSIEALSVYHADSITTLLDKPNHFFFCNRLYLLNLAAIYTTGFECPDDANVVPELAAMMNDVKIIYQKYNESFPTKLLSKAYIDLYQHAEDFVRTQPAGFEQFDRFRFIRDYVNPLFALNQKMIADYQVTSQSFNDYSLNNECLSIFDKSLYRAQDTKGIYSLVEDKAMLADIKAAGKKLFYDPILSGNNERSCASCHKPTEYFTDTSFATAEAFEHKSRLTRNTPTLINVVYNHLIMLDGKHISLQEQALEVMTNSEEMSGKGADILEKVLSCKDYERVFKRSLKYTPEARTITMDHVISAITYYYGDFSSYYAPFDEAINKRKPVDDMAIAGFNLFMSKARCGTCHFLPQFNSVGPPYVSSEFEVAGTPADTGFTKLSDDIGRYKINPAPEMMHAFRTSTVRNTAHTKPYMHNGVFTTLQQVIDFYDVGGGAGKKLLAENQTVPTDSLKLTPAEKKQLIAFITSLNENITFDAPPAELPRSSNKQLNNRKIGGNY